MNRIMSGCTLKSDKKVAFVLGCCGCEWGGRGGEGEEEEKKKKKEEEKVGERERIKEEGAQAAGPAALL